MEQYFTEIAKNELKYDLFYHPRDHIFKPFETATDFLSTLSFPVILPGYFFVLTFLAFIEALLSIGYLCYFFIKNNETDSKHALVESKSSGSVSFQMLCMCISIAPLMIIVFLFRLVATLVLAIIKNILNEFKPLQDGRSKNERVDALLQKKIMCDAISRYTTLVADANADIGIITRTLDTYNMEVNAFLKDKKEIQQQYNHVRKSLKQFSYFQATDETIALHREHEINAELLNACDELMNSYPNNSFENTVSLDEIESAYRLFEEHHAKVLEIANIMFPNLFSFLNGARLVGESKSRGIDSLKM